MTTIEASAQYRYPQASSKTPTYFRITTEIPDKLKIVREDETRMQELILGLESRGYSKAANSLERFRFRYGIAGRYPRMGS
jgi:hypothetical protein